MTNTYCKLYFLPCLCTSFTQITRNCTYKYCHVFINTAVALLVIVLVRVLVVLRGQMFLVHREILTTTHQIVLIALTVYANIHIQQISQQTVVVSLSLTFSTNKQTSGF